MTTQSLNNVIGTTSCTDIAKRVSTSSLLLSALLLVAGIACLVGISFTGNSTSPLSMTLLVGGVGLVVYAFYRFLAKARQTVYLPTGSAVKEHTLYFDLKDMPGLKRLLQEDKFDEIEHLSAAPSGNVRLDVMLSADSHFVAVQLFQFIPYSYTAVTEVCYYDHDRAEAMASFVMKCLH